MDKKSKSHIANSRIMLILSFLLTIASAIIFIIAPQAIPSEIFAILFQTIAFALGTYCWLKDKEGPASITATILSFITLFMTITCVWTGWVNNDICLGIEHVLLNQWDWAALVIACISLIFTASTLYSQRKTEKNTRHITVESQKELLKDYIRHFYCNLIIICAVYERLNKRYNLYYPSEEHLLKLNADLESLHPEAFFNHSSQYDIIHKLKFTIRNFNLELEVITKHLCNRAVCKEAKERDFNTLKFKMGNLILDTVNVIIAISEEDTNNTENPIRIKKEIREFLAEYATNRNKANTELMERAKQLFENKEIDFYYPSLTTELEKALFPEKNCTEINSFLMLLNRNIYTEIHGKNSMDSDKIFLIPFKKTTRRT